MTEQQTSKPESDQDVSHTLLPIDEHVEESSGPDGKKVRHKGVYLLPNLFTTAALFSGFYAIVSAMDGNFTHAAVAVFVAMVLDGLDGRVARLTNTQSAFGAEYDSLSDMVAFGVAPAVVVFSWALTDMGKVGWLFAFIYVAGAALRLARFNTHIGDDDGRYFTGLPSPSGAGLVAGMVWSLSDFGIDGANISVLVGIMTALGGLLMVSNFRYYSFKDLDFKGRVPFFVILVVVLVFAVISSDPSRILWAIFVGYTVSGPVMSLWRWRQRNKRPAEQGGQ
ncbi:CDP-diacylglycerol--serine O-phosphatidyltransferase [Pseudomonas neustonica]|uniref:CDP-diacylglycerol--serine O-phosphatidyltransferase n=1 Tax=Pseudomonas neustonica TaxID=2487346 RepID=A0ABX9XJC5_9PSED|nr:MULTISPECIES: CDP-diacylglycerol--serine O-phosphatidyltransferase [Pseudomonas]MBA6420053.1 CDP-diacylglycerol--serine O-phosphatidyltransferase [Pseudomonas sp. 5Ae-yellow]ROZ81852.1 CDP-diacylglycerol--serine O-phosphatidyltransferase [Pseudomonas sp. SSM44]ROZ83695.1 CDP-diacylglycerol--serine O-phosphatidyltransferase [Pseudomonas neustonica]|tara:strand:- start:66 stop:905 length:840 start_codon:yes stop_codon:yes gene_type:complete